MSTKSKSKIRYTKAVFENISKFTPLEKKNKRGYFKVELALKAIMKNLLQGISKNPCKQVGFRKCGS